MSHVIRRRSTARPEPVPAVVSLHVWGTSNVPKSLLRMGIDRRTARALPGCTFAKLLGTGSGRTFSLRDPDLHHWALLACWSEASGPERSARSAPFAEWASIASEQARFLLRPLSSRGSWSARAPFGDPSPTRWDGPIASLTRARIKPQRWAGFWRSVPAVAYDANHGPGMLFGLGIGEAPVGLQGTFSVWRDKQVLDDFAYQRSPHARVIEQTAALQWYAEELFARFALLDVSGRYDGADLAGLVSGGAPDPAGPPAAV